MNCKTVIICVAFILFFTNFTVVSTKIIQINNSIDSILYVDDDVEADYIRIQDAIDNASAGSIIFVNNGTYFENIVINKPITLIGENNETTIIDGRRKDDTVTITSKNVILSDFTITNSSYDAELAWWKAGIRITGSNSIISNNIIKNNLLGIFGKQVENITIINNKFINDSVTFYPYDTNYWKRPELLKKHFIHTIQDNTVNGKPLLYCLDQNDFEVPSNVGQLIAINCTNMKVRNATFINSDFMAILVFCSNCLIENSIFRNNDGELSLLASNNNTIQFNNISNNFHGILLDYYSENNKIHNNSISNNLYCGVICEYFSNNNLIKNNNFIKNNVTNAFFIQSYRNKWVSNYWDNWIGLKYKNLNFLPKLIFGKHFEHLGINMLLQFDWNPAEEPYKI